MQIKACGLRNFQELCWAQELGYDFWGIVLDPQSRRYLSPQELQILWQDLPPQWRTQCVFVARKWSALVLAAHQYPEALLQCYGTYPDFIPKERRFLPISSEEEWQISQVQQRAAYYLYDISLGSGEWVGIPMWCRNKPRLFVAGGLNLANLTKIGSSERGYRFFGFDLSSGLEDQETGRKNYQKMADCIRAIRQNFLA